MKILVFGNPDYPQDSLAIKVSKKINNFPGITFRYIHPNDDISPQNDKRLYLLDTIIGIDKVTLLTEKDIDKLLLPPRTTIHDYDLGFQLKYLKKIGKLNSLFIIGLPITGEVDYDLIHSILRKLVAQDIQGS